MNNKRSEPFKLIIDLFTEGDTELDYLQKFITQQKKDKLVKIIKKEKNPNPVKLVNASIDFYKENFLGKNQKNRENREIWIIFDHDGRENEVKQAIDNLQNSNFCHKINIAFNKPCIEIWPLLHNFIDNVSTQRDAQSKLKNIMPSFNHDRTARFDLKKMPNYNYAVEKAKAWQLSLNTEPEYNASKFAGIYKITEKIIATS